MLPAPNLFVHIPLMLWKFCMFPGHLPKHQASFFFSDIPFNARTYITFIADISDILLLNLFEHIWLMLQKFLISHDIYLSTRAVCFRYSRHYHDMYCIWHINFRYFRHSMPHLFVHILLMLWKFHIFFRTFTQAPGLFFSDILDTSRICITFGIFISDILDIQHLIYLCTFCRSSRISRFFSEHLPTYQDCFFRYSRHFQDMCYI